MTATVLQLAIGPMLNFAYLILDPTAGVCAAVDPGWEPDKLVQAATQAGCKIDKILLTHTHYDHAREVKELVRLTGAPVFVHEAERAKLAPDLNVQTTHEGSEIRVGSLVVRCLHTPGHTPGSQCFQVGDALLTGDTLFVGDCGRDDLPGSSPAALVASMRRLAGLAPGWVVYPGHNYGPTPRSTVGEQRASNPCIKAALALPAR